MYKKLDMFRGAEERLEMIVIGYWEPEEGSKIVKTFTYIDESHKQHDFRNSNVIGCTLEKVVRDQEGCGFTTQ